MNVLSRALSLLLIPGLVASSVSAIAQERPSYAEIIEKMERDADAGVGRDALLGELQRAISEGDYSREEMTQFLYTRASPAARAKIESTLRLFESSGTRLDERQGVELLRQLGMGLRESGMTWSETCTGLIILIPVIPLFLIIGASTAAKGFKMLKTDRERGQDRIWTGAIVATLVPAICALTQD